MKLILVVSVALAAPGLLGSDDIFKSFDDVEQGFDNNFASDFGGAFGASPFLKGGLLDRGAAPRSARTDNQPSQKGSAFFCSWVGTALFAALAPRISPSRICSDFKDFRESDPAIIDVLESSHKDQEHFRSS